MPYTNNFKLSQSFTLTWENFKCSLSSITYRHRLPTKTWVGPKRIRMVAIPLNVSVQPYINIFMFTVAEWQCQNDEQFFLFFYCWNALQNDRKYGAPSKHLRNCAKSHSLRPSNVAESLGQTRELSDAGKIGASPISERLRFLHRLELLWQHTGNTFENAFLDQLN